MIRYFQEELRPSIWAQLDIRGQKLDFWKEAVKKTVDAEAKILLQPPSSTHEIDAKYLCGYRPAKKKKKDLERNKSTDTFFADVSSGKHPQQSSIYQSQTGNKDQDR